MAFSRRTAWERTPNAFTRAVEHARSSGHELVDLTVTDPTGVGLELPSSELGAVLGDPRSARYRPEPLGLLEARAAITAHYRSRGIELRPEQVVLTTGTSEAYSLLFKLLADPGDAILVPRPSYPLLDVLAGLEPLELRPYALVFDGRWSIDLGSVQRALAGARALVLVAPHNPTGHHLLAAERAAILELARAHEVPLIVDEVFAGYVEGHRSFADEAQALTFTLSGLSKVACLPQLKLGWIVVSGPEGQREEALARLEHLADAFLSVATPVQLALPELMRLGDGLRGQLRARICANRAALRASRPSGASWDVLDGEGWYALIRVPRTRPLAEWCGALLEAGLIVHPGELYDLDRPHALVVSLLPEPEKLLRGLELLRAVLG